MGQAYTGFADVYDLFMDGTPYRDWARYIASLIDRYGISMPFGGKVKGQGAALIDKEKALLTERNLVVELGCGTGSFTEEMAALGYDMIGIDPSPEMLQKAFMKKEKSGSDILYLEQDMRDLDLYSTAGTFISVCDSVNYLLRREDLLSTFRLVNQFLYPKGLFVFDFNTVHKYRDLIGDTTIAENREEASFIWENTWYEENHINEYDLTFFAALGPSEQGDSLGAETLGAREQHFRRFQETHYQRGYEAEEMAGAIEEAGMKVIALLDADTHEKVTNQSERIYMLAREQGK